MESAITKIAEQSPLLAIAAIALFIVLKLAELVYKLAEQKVGMATRQAEREKEVAQQYLGIANERKGHVEMLIKVIDENNKAIDKFSDMLVGLKEAIDKSRTRAKAQT